MLKRIQNHNYFLEILLLEYLLAAKVLSQAIFFLLLFFFFNTTHFRVSILTQYQFLNFRP